MRENQEKVLDLLRAIAKSESNEEYDKNITTLTEDPDWKDSRPNFKNWIENTWLSCHQVC